MLGVELDSRAGDPGRRSAAAGLPIVPSSGGPMTQSGSTVT